MCYTLNQNPIFFIKNKELVKWRKKSVGIFSFWGNLKKFDVLAPCFLVLPLNLSNYSFANGYPFL